MMTAEAVVAPRIAVELQHARGLPRVGVTRGDATAWVEAALAESGLTPESPVGVTLRFVDEAESAALNERYRGRPAPTNVLAFDGPGAVGEPGTELGDLVLCVPVVMAEAAAQRKTFAAHLAHMVIHGTLHLLGQDHRNDAEARDMEAREVRALDALGVADPYLDAADD